MGKIDISTLERVLTELGYKPLVIDDLGSLYDVLLQMYNEDHSIYFYITKHGDSYLYILNTHYSVRTEVKVDLHIISNKDAIIYTVNKTIKEQRSCITDKLNHLKDEYTNTIN